MKKLLLLLMCGIITANAQIATQNSKFTDNWNIGIEGGVFTPLTFDPMFPLNSAAGVKVGKEITPEFGLQLEGLGLFNNNGLNSTPTGIKATNVGMNGTINLSNVFYGYKGKPRWFEVQTNTGLGWLYTWNTDINNLSAKTGVDFLFNLPKGHGFVLTPQISWNLNKIDKIQFNKNESQLGVMLSYVYHFKNSNGTHSFKQYNISELNDEINRLRNTPPKTKIVKEKEFVREQVNVIVNPFVVTFAKNSSLITTESMQILNTIPQDAIVDILGTASPEGTEEVNYKLSLNRAESVASYLRDRKVKVRSVEGIGAYGDTSQRIVIINIANGQSY